MVIPRMSRTKEMVEMVTGKIALDIGCIGGIDNPMHRAMAKVAKRIVGLDIREQEIEMLKKEGFDIRLMSVDESPFDLHEKFDVIVAGALIEHLYNLRIFLENVKKHMKTEGVFVGTVHNPQAFERFLECWVWRKAVHIKYHTHWQSERTLKYLFEQCGLELVRVKYIQQFGRSKIGKAFDILFWWLPSWFSRTILFTAQLAEGGKG